MKQNFHHLSLSTMFLHREKIKLPMTYWQKFEHSSLGICFIIDIVSQVNRQCFLFLGGKCKILAHFTINCLFFKLINLFIYLFLAVLGLRFCVRAFSSCGKRGPLFITVCGPLTIAASCCGAQAPDAQAQQLWLTGPAAPRHVGSSQTRARTRVPCIGRWILSHCATREALINCLFDKLK